MEPTILDKLMELKKLHEAGILTKEELDTILSPENMIKPVKLDIKPRR